MINTAVVGFGLSGKAFHTPFLHVNPGFRIVKVLERHKTESKAVYDYVEVVKTLGDIINDPAIDLVVITSPNEFHFSQAEECLSAGKHIVVEKPFMTNSRDCERIIELATANDLRVFVYHNRRWDGDFLTIQKIIDSGVLGDIRHYEAHFDRFSPERKRAAWRDEDKPGSGILFDLGPHLIDQALVLFGKPDAISADIQNQRKGSLVDDFFRINLYYPGKEIILTAGMLVKDHHLRYLIHGSNGSFIKNGLDPQEARLRLGELPNSNGWGMEEPENYGLITIDDEDEDYDGSIETIPGNYMGFYDNVRDVLLHNADQKVKPEEAKWAIRIIELAFKSNKNKKRLDVDL